MMRRTGTLVSALVLSTWACGPAVTVTHLEPAPYNLGRARKLVLVEAEGIFAGERVGRVFLEQVSGGGVLSIQDATRERMRLATLGSGAAAREAKEFRRSWPADVYVGLDADLQSHDRVNRRRKKTDDGDVEVIRYFAEAECELRLRLLDARDGRELATFSVTQSARSATSDSPTTSLRDDAEERAIESAVADAVSQFSPRLVRERLALDKKAPLAPEGLKLVEAGDLAGTRRLWENALEANSGNAPLRYNLGAVCEALRDRRAARRYYEDAIRLDPAEPKYRQALDALEVRRQDTKALKKPG